jgi:hypothetical protein
VSCEMQEQRAATPPVHRTVLTAACWEAGYCVWLHEECSVAGASTAVHLSVHLQCIWAGSASCCMSWRVFSTLWPRGCIQTLAAACKLHEWLHKLRSAVRAHWWGQHPVRRAQECSSWPWLAAMQPPYPK